MSQREWSESTDGAFLRVLAKHTRMPEALAELSKIFDCEVSRHAVDRRLKKLGIGTAKENLGIAHEPSPGLNVCATGPAVVEPANDCELRRTLYIPDCHHPYVNLQAWNLMLDVARDFAPHTIIICGDFMDMYTVSDHEKMPGNRASLDQEFMAANAALDELDALGAKRKEYIEGNHEYRLRRHIAKGAPELYSMVQLQDKLRLKERGWTFTPYRKEIRIGKVHITHDVGYAGMNAVRQSRARFEGNAVIGHVHRMNILYEGNAAGETHVGACFGWLGDRDSLAVDYASTVQKARDWTLGFGIGFEEPNGTTHLQAIPIIAGRCVVSGKLYTARPVARVEDAA